MKHDDDYPPWGFALLIAGLMVLAFAAAMLVPR